MDFCISKRTFCLECAQYYRKKREKTARTFLQLRQLYLCDILAQYIYNNTTLLKQIKKKVTLTECIFVSAYFNYICKIKLYSALTESARLLISPEASAINESFTFTCINLVKVLCRRTFQRVIYDSMRHQDHAILLNGGLLLSRARTRYSRVRVHATQTSRFKRDIESNTFSSYRQRAYTRTTVHRLYHCAQQREKCARIFFSHFH